MGLRVVRVLQATCVKREGSEEYSVSITEIIVLYKTMMHSDNMEDLYDEAAFFLQQICLCGFGVLF